MVENRNTWTGVGRCRRMLGCLMAVVIDESFCLYRESTDQAHELQGDRRNDDTAFADGFRERSLIVPSIKQRDSNKLKYGV